MAVLGRMTFIRNRRLLVARLAQAMAAGELPKDSVDLVALLFGDNATWVGTAGDAAILQATLDDAVAKGHLSTGATRHHAIALARSAILQALVEERRLQEAAARGGRDPKKGADSEFRAIRASLDHYLEYLADRAAYEELERQVRSTYSGLASAATTVAALAERLGVNAEDAEETSAIFDSFVAAHASPDRRAIPTRASPLLDRHGRSRWPEGGLRRRPLAAPASQEAPKAPEDAVPQSAREKDFLKRDAAVLNARLMRDPDDTWTRNLPADWESIELSQERIVELMPYPRADYLSVALQKFGHRPYGWKFRPEPAILELLERQAAPVRRRLLEATLHMDRPQKLLGRNVPEAWWRAATYYQWAREEAGSKTARDKWPQRWDLLLEPHSDTYSDHGFGFLADLDAIIEAVTEYESHDSAELSGLYAALEGRGSPYPKIVDFFREHASFEDGLDSVISEWLDAVSGRDDEWLPGFVTR